jgi:hypothetical protein
MPAEQPRLRSISQNTDRRQGLRCFFAIAAENILLEASKSADLGNLFPRPGEARCENSEMALSATYTLTVWEIAIDMVDRGPRP